VVWASRSFVVSGLRNYDGHLRAFLGRAAQEAPMAERWRAEIHYAGYPDTTMMFENLGNFGALVEMDPRRDAIADITITPNRSQRAQEIPQFLRSGQQAS
jgi:hypothetical protein